LDWTERGNSSAGEVEFCAEVEEGSAIVTSSISSLAFCLPLSTGGNVGSGSAGADAELEQMEAAAPAQELSL
jgi:hypothetical protein